MLATDLDRRGGEAVLREDAGHATLGRQAHQHQVATAGLLDAGLGEAQFDAGDGLDERGIGCGEANGHGRTDRVVRCTAGVVSHRAISVGRRIVTAVPSRALLGRVDATRTPDSIRGMRMGDIAPDLRLIRMTLPRRLSSADRHRCATSSARWRASRPSGARPSGACMPFPRFQRASGRAAVVLCALSLTAVSPVVAGAVHRHRPRRRSSCRPA